MLTEAEFLHYAVHLHVVGVGSEEGAEPSEGWGKSRLNVIIVKALNPQYWSRFKFNPQLDRSRGIEE